eukprot:TRINITY_DN21201_c0_g1_i2.p1 TRINITY_DN21201_c0_g1~~TRINITY_DN21201_c0_g1_i2.p1  ORF type:complete len:863 (+),score=237.14 TRINITY_DN21201_c0_g1_i2:269-2590(+)
MAAPFNVGAQWAQGWAKGSVTVGSAGCYRLTAEGPIREVWLDTAPLLGLWYGGESTTATLPAGRTAVHVRVDGVGLSFRLAVQRCSRARVSLLPQDVDDWNRGHSLPDVVLGRPLSGLLAATALLSVDAREPVAGLRLEVSGPSFETAAAALPPLTPGVPYTAAAPLRATADMQQDACPAAVTVRVVEGDGNEHARQQVRLRCRAARESVTFVYADVDGSPQVASAKLPALAGCADGGCGVLLSTHGMDVTAQRQADCYRPMRDRWVVAPHGRGTHALNWQGPGHWSATAALRALQSIAGKWNSSLRINASKVIYTGHSNGGFGAVLLAALDPDSAAAVAPLAGMATIGDSQHAAPPRRMIDPTLQGVLDSAGAEYRGDLVLSNLVGVPYLSRAGERDQVISPWLSRKAVRLLSEYSNETGRGQSVRYVELKGKEHWWWDTEAENDGGVMDDKQMRKLWQRAMRMGPPPPPSPCFDFTCYNAASCGTRGGLRVAVQRRPLRRSTVRACRVTEGWALRTSNTLRLVLSADSPVLSSPSAVAVDGTRFSGDELRRAAAGGAATLCSQAPGVWVACGAGCGADDSHQRGCCGPVRRGPGALGPLRRVFARPYAIVYGTQETGSVQMLRAAAMRLASAAARVAKAAPTVTADVDAAAAVPHGANVVLLGSRAQNSVTAASRHPIVQSPAGPGVLAMVPCPLWAEYPDSAAAVVAGEDVRGFLSAYDLLMASQWTTNHWQMLLPDFVVAGPDYAWQGLAGVESAGYWNSDWEPSEGVF